MQEVANTQTYIHNKLVADVTALETALIGKCAIICYYFCFEFSSLFVRICNARSKNDGLLRFRLFVVGRCLVFTISFCLFIFYPHSQAKGGSLRWSWPRSQRRQQCSNHPAHDLCACQWWLSAEGVAGPAAQTDLHVRIRIYLVCDYSVPFRPSKIFFACRICKQDLVVIA